MFLANWYSVEDWEVIRDDYLCGVEVLAEPRGLLIKKLTVKAIKALQKIVEKEWEEDHGPTDSDEDPFPEFKWESPGKFNMIHQVWYAVEKGAHKTDDPYGVLIIRKATILKI